MLNCLLRLTFSIVIGSFITIHLFAAWYHNYDNALQAIEQGDWEKAVAELHEALRQDSRPDERKRVGSSTRRTSYFPYYHLGRAYYELGDLSSASENFGKALAHGKLDPYSSTQATIAFGRISEFQDLISAANSRAADRRFWDVLESLDSLRELEPKLFQDSIFSSDLNELLQRASEVTGKWENAVSEAREAMRSGDLKKAEESFSEANEAYPGVASLYPERNQVEVGLDSIRRYRALIASARESQSAGQGAEAVRNLKAAQELQPAAARLDGVERLIEEIEVRAAESSQPEQPSRTQLAEQSYQVGLNHLEGGRFEEAVNSFEASLSHVPGFRDASVLRDRAEARVRFASGSEAEERGRYTSALTEYKRASVLDPNFRLASEASTRIADYDNVSGRAAQVLSSNRTGDVDDLMVRLRQIDRRRFSLDSRFKSLSKPAEVSPGVLKAALLRLFKSKEMAEVDSAIDGLKKLLEDGAEDPPIIAYLGVGYAIKAFLSPNKSEDAKRFRELAIERFSEVLDIDSTFSLSDSLVSPRIRLLFSEVRIEKGVIG